jgi:Tol biopolymer transport system component
MQLTVNRQFIHTTFLSLLLLNVSLWAQQAQPAQATSRAGAIYDSMPAAKPTEQVTVSPDGSKLAWTEGASIVIAAPTAGAPTKSLKVPNNLPVRELTWSPDSTHIAFIADLAGEKPAAEVYLADAGDGSSRKLAEFRGFISTPRFSPDGKTLAVLFIENMPRAAGALVPMTLPEGVIEEHYYEQRITTVDVASGNMRQVSPADMYVYEYDWSPDGRNWAATAAHGSGDNNWWIARLYAVDGQSGAMREVYKPKLQIAVPRFSPDGKQIAFISGIMSDFGVTGGDVYVISASGGEARNLTPGMKASATWLTWSSPNAIVFTEVIDGNSGVAQVSASGGDVKTTFRTLSRSPRRMARGFRSRRTGRPRR